MHPSKFRIPPSPFVPTHYKPGIPEKYVQGVLGLDPFDIKDEVRLNNHLGSLAQSREMHFISCWHLYRKEELGIWEQYGHDGAAVCTRYELLKAALAGLLDETHLGLVQYGTDHLTDRFNALEFITTKQAKYRTDCEVRAMLTSLNPLEGGNRHFDLNNFPHREPLEMNPRHPWVPECKRRRIILRDLVQEVVISPWAEPDEAEEIKLWTKSKISGATKDSELRNDKTATLEEYREHAGIKKREPEEERLASQQELERFHEELSTLTPSRVRFLYRQRWEKCRLHPSGLPNTLDVQYLEATLRVLKDWKRQGIDVS